MPISRIGFAVKEGPASPPVGGPSPFPKSLLNPVIPIPPDMGEATNETVNVLLTKLMMDRHCGHDAQDFDACVVNHVPSKSDGSYVDQSIQRRGLRKCEPYKAQLHQCLQNEKHQQAIMRQASKAPTCKDERQALARCQQMTPSRGLAGDAGKCEREAIEMIMCGLVYMVQKGAGRSTA